MKKNAILKGIGYGVTILFLLSACCIDSESMIPSIICLICGLYLAAFSYANDGFKKHHNIDKSTDTYRLTNITWRKQ